MLVGRCSSEQSGHELEVQSTKFLTLPQSLPSTWRFDFNLNLLVEAHAAWQSLPCLPQCS
jgi:hypothetical protein